MINSPNESMKTRIYFILSVAIATNLIGQPAANPAATSPVVEPAKAPPARLSTATLDRIARMTPLFDGKTLDGWIQAPPYALTISGDDIPFLPSLVQKLVEKSDPVSAFVSGQLDEAVRKDVAAFTAASTNSRALKSAMVRNINKVLSGPSIYDETRFRDVLLRPETRQLRQQNPQGQELSRLNRLLLEDAWPVDLSKSPAASWAVQDGAMSSLGAGRGVIYTKGEYTNYRLIFTMRPLGGPPADHAPCVLIFGSTPPAGEKGLDALGGIQFQPPNGGSWDYRPGKNNDGKGLFTRLVRPGFNSKEWHQVELLVNADTGTARMAVAQPVGSKAIEVLQFKDPTAGKKGPIAWQMHNKGLFDEFKDVRIEVVPKEGRLITVD